MEDKDIALFILKWGSDVRVLVFMICLLIVMIALNIWLWRRRKQQRDSGPMVEWTQNLEELEVDFPIPEGTTSRDIECRIMPTTIRFAIRGQAKEMNLEVSGPCSGAACQSASS